MEVGQVHAQSPGGEGVERVVEVSARPKLEEHDVDSDLLFA